MNPYLPPQKDIVLYIKQNDVNSALAIQLAQQRNDVHIQNVQALPKQHIPKWLNIVPTCVVRSTKGIYKGKQAIDLLKTPKYSFQQPPSQQQQPQPQQPHYYSPPQQHTLQPPPLRPQYQPPPQYPQTSNQYQYQQQHPTVNHLSNAHLCGRESAVQNIPGSIDTYQPCTVQGNTSGCLLDQNAFSPMFTREQEKQLENMDSSNQITEQSLQQYQKMREEQMKKIISQRRPPVP